MKLNRSEPTSGGAGFQVGDVLEPVGGKAARSARLKVATITAKGAITALEIIEPGDYSNEPQPPIALAYPNDSTGSGRDATVNLAFNETSRGWLFRGYLFVLMLLSLGIGKWVGTKIGIQRRLNAIGASARYKFTKATEQSDEKHPPSEGFITCTRCFVWDKCALARFRRSP